MSARPNRPFTRRAALAGAAACAAGWAVPATATAGTREGSVLVVRDATVFDGRRRLGRATVVVAGAWIRAVGSHAAVPAGAEVVDGRDKTLLPGLVDGHVHAISGLSPDPLRFGVTTELDMFAFLDTLGPYRRRRASTATANVSDLWSAGVLATVPGGHGTEYGEIPTLAPDAGRAAVEDFVARRVAEGSDYVKVIMEDGSLYGGGDTPTLSPTQVGYLVDAAHRHGLLCVVHVATQRDAGIAAELGADGLTHVPGDAITGRVLEVIRRSGVFVIPTLSVYNMASCGGRARELASDPLVIPFLTAQQRKSLNSSFGRCYPAIYPAALNNVRLLHEAGVPLVAGTDAGNPGTTRGASLLSELTLLTDAGLSPVDALRAATGEPARWFPIGPRGRIAPGHRADLLLVNGDATQDVSVVRDIARIWRNGHPVDRQPVA